MRLLRHDCCPVVCRGARHQNKTTHTSHIIIIIIIIIITIIM